MDFDNIKHLVPPETSVRLLQSTVIGLEPLRITSGLAARRAASCLVSPELGDTVLCCADDNGQATILAVIERQAPNLPLQLHTSCPISLQAPEFHFTSQVFNIDSTEMTVNVSLFKRIADRVEDVVEYLNLNVNSLFTRAKRSIKHVEDIDDTRAGHLRLESDTIAHLHGEVTVVSGEKLVQLQSQQIHMG